jgi:hypothetical protein
VEVEEGSSSGVSSRCLRDLSPLAGPEARAGGAGREADEWGGSEEPAASGWSGAAAAYGGGFTSQSKSNKDGWRVGSSCRIGFLGELTGVGVFPDTASIAVVDLKCTHFDVVRSIHVFQDVCNIFNVLLHI